MKPIVEVQELSKLFRLGNIGASSMRHMLNQWFGRKARTESTATTHPQKHRRNGPEPNTFWALKNVSFDVQRGQVIGIIGRNGAGKSTLLKILSRITEPSSGRAILRGRIASLLEVGTGFHPELTGRENIFLNGAILGMKRWEIVAKFDEIVEFAEIGQFIDTPVKRYSSGMFVRLAFAVAAHLEPEILLIDEVLAVGDAGFQKRCIGKMSEVSTQHGRTVFFVSHNMGALRQLCDTCVLIEGGELQAQGAPGDVIRDYLNFTIPADAAELGERIWVDETQAPGGDELRLRRLRVLGSAGTLRTTFEAGEPVHIEITYSVKTRLRGARFDLAVLTQEGDIAFVATDHSFQPEVQPPGMYKSVCIIPGGLLNRRTYVLKLQAIVPGERALLWEAEYLTFVVSGAGNQSSSHPENWPGVVCPRIHWTIEALGSAAMDIGPRGSRESLLAPTA